MFWEVSTVTVMGVFSVCFLYSVCVRGRLFSSCAVESVGSDEILPEGKGGGEEKRGKYLARRCFEKHAAVSCARSTSMLLLVCCHFRGVFSISVTTVPPLNGLCSSSWPKNSSLYDGWREKTNVGTAFTSVSTRVVLEC